MYLRRKLSSGCSWPVAPWVWPTLMTILVLGDRAISALAAVSQAGGADIPVCPWLGQTGMSAPPLNGSLLLRVAGRAPLFLQGIGQPAVVARLVLVDE